jgi:site-specific DNA recombinase
MKAIILARVSTEEQREAGNSLPAQEYRCMEYAQRKGFNVIKTISFDESAYKNKRKQFDQVVEFILTQKEPIAVCMDKVDRLSRNVFDTRIGHLYHLALEGKIELHFVSDHQVISDKLSATEKSGFSMSLVMAGNYSNVISDNVKRAFEQKRRNGEWTGRPKIGYRTITGSGKNYQDIDPLQSKYVKRMFELYAEGNQSVKTLRDLLYKESFRSREGKKVSTSQIHKMLRDRFYIGIMTVNGKDYPHKYPKIVSQSLFDKVQDILEGRSKKPTKYASKPFVFRGMITCEKCGGSISGELKKGKYIYYSCSNFKGICDRKGVREEILLKPVYDTLASIKLSQDKIDFIVESLKNTHKDKQDYHNSIIKGIQKEYTEIQSKKDRLVDMFIDLSITQEIYDRKMSELQTRQQELQIQLEEYTQADQEYHITVSRVLDLAKRASQIFESSEVNEKRQILGMLLSNCRVSEGKLLWELKSPFDVIASAQHHPIGLRLVDMFRTIEWGSFAISESILRYESSIL